MKKLFISIGVCIAAISLAIGAFFLISHSTGDKPDKGTIPVVSTTEEEKKNTTTTVETTTEETEDPDGFRDENVDDKGWL